jgi:hypothetical protein
MIIGSAANRVCSVMAIHVVRLLWGSLIDELTTTYDTAQGEHCRPGLLLIDEAGRTAIPHLAVHATTVVGRGISL